MKDISQFLRTFYRGQAPKRAYLKYMMIPITIFIIAVTVAISFFPAPGFTPMNNHVSDMGGIASNPAVWWFFDVSIFFVGILMTPNFVYLYHRLMPTAKWLTSLVTFCGLVGCIGFSVLGMFPQDFATPHDIAADLSFGGLGGAAFLTMFVFLRKMWIKASWPSWKAFLALYGPLIVAMTFLLIAQSIDPLPGIDPRWFTWPPWQWIALLSVLYWIILIGIIIPDLPAKQAMPLN